MSMFIFELFYYSFFFCIVYDQITPESFLGATVLPKESPDREALAKIDQREKEIQKELIALLTPQSYKKRYDQELSRAQQEHEEKMKAFQAEFEAEEKNFQEEQAKLEKEISELDANGNALFAQLYSEISSGQQQVAQLKSEQAAIHAKMNEEMASTSRDIDKHLSEHSKERESIRREFVFLLFSFLSFFHNLCHHLSLYSHMYNSFLLLFLESLI